MAAEIVSFMLNGRETVVVTDPLETLKNVLRDRLGYMATKTGCSQGGCGSCTVLVDGEPMVSCLLPAKDMEGREVTTLEGLTKRKLQYAYDDWRPGDQPVFVCNVDKAKQDFGWEPRTAPEEGVTKLFDWVSKNTELFLQEGL